MALSATIPLDWNKNIGELWSTNTRDYTARVASLVYSAHSAYANAFEFGSWDFTTRRIATPKLSPNRTHGNGRPHVGLCHIFLVRSEMVQSKQFAFCFFSKQP